jgi:hypothetical protein
VKAKPVEVHTHTTTEATQGTDQGKVWCRMLVKASSNYQVIEVEAGLSHVVGDDPRTQLWEMKETLSEAIENQLDALGHNLAGFQKQ